MDTIFFDIDKFKSEYLLLKSQLRGILSNHAVDESICSRLVKADVGVWIASNGFKEFGNYMESLLLEVEHKRLCDQMEEFIAFEKKGNKTEAKKTFHSIENTIQILLTLLDELEARVNSGEMDVDSSEEVDIKEQDSVIKKLIRTNVRQGEQISKLSTQLEELKNRFQLITKATNDAIWDWDFATNRIWWNEGFTTLFGYSNSVHEGFESWLSRLHPEDRDRVVNSIHSVIDSGKDRWSDEYRFCKSDNSYAFIFDRGYVVRDENGRPCKMLGSMQDISRQKQAENRLIGVSNEIKFLLNFIPPLIFSTYPNGKAYFMNERWMEYTGLKEEDLLGDNWLNVLHPDDVDSTIMAWENTVTTEAPYRVHYRIRRHDGKYHWFEAEALPFKDQSGQITKWFGTCIDIEDLKRAEKDSYQSIKELNDSKIKTENEREYLYSLLMQLPAAITIVKGPDHIIDFSNISLQKLLGSNLKAGRPLRESVVSLNGQWFMETVHRVYTTGESETFKQLNINAHPSVFQNQEKLYYNIFFQRLINKSDNTMSVMVFGTNVTESVLAHKKLEDNEKLLHQILNGLPHIAWSFLPGSKVIESFNQQWFDYTGQSPEDVASGKWLEILHPEDRKYFDDSVILQLEKEHPLQVEHRYRRTDGKYRWHLIRIVPIKDERGKILLWVGTATDIHEQKSARHKLEKTSKELQEKNFELDQFVYKTSHDLRSPLTSILGLVNIIKKEKSEEARLEYVNLIENRVLKLDAFIHAMLEYSRNARAVITFKKVDVEALLEESISELSSVKNFDRVKIVSEVKGTELYSDVFRLKIIFSNLISNSIKYQDFAKPESKLSIKVEVTESEANILLEDNGVGISDQYQEKIFGMFFRATEQSEGSGLGLYIVKQAIVALQGEISFESEFGKGTKFIIKIPNSYNLA